MGISICCIKGNNIFEITKDQSSLNEAILKEIDILNEILKEKKNLNKEILRDYIGNRYSPYSTKYLKGAIKNVEDHFYITSLIYFLEEIEKRLRNENFKEFNKVKSKFIEFFTIASENYDYNCLYEEAKRFNKFLDLEEVNG